MRIIKKMKFNLLATLFCAPAIASIDVEQSVLNMKVTVDGINRVSYEDILATNIDLSGISIRQLAVFNNGELVPAKIETNGQEAFGPGSYIEFVGFTDDNIYQNGSVYSILLTNGIHISENEASYKENQASQIYYTQTDFYNENTEYSFGSPLDDPWFYKRVLAIGSPASETIEFDLNNLVNSGQVEIQLNIWGGTDYLQTPDHHVNYNLNGSELDDFWFDGISADIRRYSMGADLFISGNQQLTVTLPGDTNTVADVVHIDSWQIKYPRAFVFEENKIDYPYHNSQTNNGDMVFANGFEVEVTNFTIQNASDENYSIYKISESGNVESYQSQVIGNCSQASSLNCSLKFATEKADGHVFVAAESQVNKPELSVPVLLTDIKQPGNADYLIISHPDFIGSELDQFIQLKSLDYNVLLVDVEQIYAQFGFNNVSADSIANYIKYARNNFGISNVLLVGGDTYDYKNYLGLNSVSFIPTQYVQTDSLVRFAPADAKYVDIDNDNIPDINIGRLPVRTVSELTNLIQKINDYSNKSYHSTSVFAADEFDSSTGYSFKNDAETLINLLPQNWKDNIGLENRAFVDDDGVDDAKSKITSNINQGVALTSFVGHSGPRDWSFSRMFSAGDALSLVNASNPTLVTQWGCWNTYFVSPEEDTMAHAFMLNQNGGAASVLGASTLTKAEHERGLAQLVLTYLTQDQMTLGDAVTQAKRVYAQNNPDAFDVILGWNILGDPGLKL